MADNVYAAYDRRRGCTYYRYKHPQTGRFHGLGTDKAKANRAARKLNNKLAPGDAQAGDLAERIAAEGTVRLGALAERFKAHLREKTDAKGNRRSAKTLDDYDRYVDDAVAHFGAGADVDEIGRRAVSAYLDQFPARSYNARRTVLRQLFALHVATSDNPVDGTLTRTHVVERARLTQAEYDRIWKIAPHWFRVAMDLSLRSLQSRLEVAHMRYSDEREPGYLFVDRQKVARHEAGHIRIAVGPRLREVITRSREDALASPFIVHRLPERRRRDHLQRKEHWTQVRPERLTREFARLRDKAEVRSDLPAKQRPTFHEIRSLGGRLLEEAGWSDEAIQALYGHTTAAMTKKYLDRRGREVQYTDAEAG